MTARRETIQVPSTDGTFSAYLAVPARPNGIIVVVLQEIFGVNANIRALTEGFAEQGHVAIAPDLYWRQVAGIELDPASADGRAQALELMKGLDREQAAADGIAALAAAHKAVPGMTHTAAVGYCFGGGVAYLMAVRNLVDAGVAYYGTYLHTVLAEAQNLDGKLLLHIAENDHLCPPDARAAIQQAVAPLLGAQVIIHPGVGHAFARQGGDGYDAAAAKRANDMTFALLSSLAA